MLPLHHRYDTRRAHPDLENLESRVHLAADPSVRSYDGTGNNVAHPLWGSAGTALMRLVAAQYTDGKSSPAGADRAMPRDISNKVAAHPAGDEILSASSLSAFTYLWGQFLDHDLDLTTAASPTESFPVMIPGDDKSFPPGSSIPLSRSVYTVDAKGVRQQLNVITSYIDGSVVYGSDSARADALRTKIGGRLKTSAGNLLPFNTPDLNLPNANDAHRFADSQLFAAGDVRANENSELTSLQTLMMREHNRLADQIAAANRGWDDEKIYQKTRRLVIGEIQNITYNEFIPALLGQSALSRYSGYNSNVNASVSNEFSTAAFRLGHSMLTDDVEFIDNDGTELREEMALSDVFFNPSVIEETGIDPILKYLSSSRAEEIDNFVVNSVRNFLFGAPGAGGLDLAALNIQRGREHGIASYIDTRAALGLGKITSFGQITSNPDVAAALQSAYGTVDKVDLWVGGLAEDHVRGGNLGATFRKILIDQFTRTRDGDRFWFERDLSGGDLSRVRNTSLADIIKSNTGLTNLQSNVFVFDVDVSGRVTAGFNRYPRRFFNPVGVPNVTLQLINDEGEIVDTATTGRDGRYEFQNLEIGDFTIVPVSYRGVALPAAPLNVHVSRGGNLSGFNFDLRKILSSVLPPASTGAAAGTTIDLDADLDQLAQLEQLV